jgi:hypothetical protein
MPANLSVNFGQSPVFLWRPQAGASLPRPCAPAGIAGLNSHCRLTTKALEASGPWSAPNPFRGESDARADRLA